MDIRKRAKESYYFSHIYYLLKYKIPALIQGDRRRIEKAFYQSHGYVLDVDNPITVNEKIQWLKLYDRKDVYCSLVDKLEVKKYIVKRFGAEYIANTLCVFDSWRDVNKESLPNEPFILKANTGTGTWQIIRNKKDTNIKKLRTTCRKWININHYYESQEWQYKNIKPKIFAEKLLTDDNGNIPYDYKLHFMGGELQFIYCVVDREGENYRAMFSPSWELLPFQWVSKQNKKEINCEINVEPPKNLDKMIEFGEIIAKEFEFKYVRIDYYECKDKLYFGEVTLHHGSGMNKFYPPEAELDYQDKINISVKRELKQ